MIIHALHTGQQHANIVQLYDVKKCEKYIILILEFCDGGDLSKAIKSCRSKTQKTAFKEPVALYLMRQLAQGMRDPLIEAKGGILSISKICCGRKQTAGLEVCGHSPPPINQLANTQVHQKCHGLSAIITCPLRSSQIDRQNCHLPQQGLSQWRAPPLTNSLGP